MAVAISVEGWRAFGLIERTGHLRGLVIFYASNNLTGTKVALDTLRKLGWGPVMLDLADRVEAALKSNLSPADPEKLSPAARRLLARLRQKAKK